MPKVTRPAGPEWPNPSKWKQPSSCRKCHARGRCYVSDLKDVGPSRDGSAPRMSVDLDVIFCGIPCPTPKCSGRWNIIVPMAVWKVYCSHVKYESPKPDDDDDD